MNQHGDNRGDEAALTAMLDGLEQRLGPTRFTVLHQFRDPDTRVEVDHRVEWMSLVIGVVGLCRLGIYVALARLHLHPVFVLDRRGRRIVDAYRRADVVISAPGGPYFGDIYADHEPVHWLYVWLARVERCPTALYATSAGPFEKRWRNPFRRWTYRCFDIVIVREERSARLVRSLMGPHVEVEVTTDSAFQQRVDPIDRAAWMVDGAPVGDRFVVVVSAIEYPYPGAADPERRQRTYDHEVVDAVMLAVRRGGAGRGAHVAFMPQLHSARRDSPYLERLAAELGTALDGTALDETALDGGADDALDVTVEVVDESLDCVAQRRRFAAADVVLAGRYHPTVFAISAEVPVLAIPYEHKATGVMEAAGLGRHVIEIGDVEAGVVGAAMDRLLDDRAAVTADLATAAPALARLSATTSARVAALVAAS